MAGTVTIEGGTEDIKKRLEVNPKTKIPQILFTVYQHVFSAIYVLSSVLGTPYPPPDLLHPMQEKIQIVSSGTPKTSSQDCEEKETGETLTTTATKENAAANKTA